MTSRKNRVLYTGATNDLHSRLFGHKSKINPGFTSRYQIDKLVYYECFLTSEEAFEREEQIKSWSRAKKIALIESISPEWKDLSGERNGKVCAGRLAIRFEGGGARRHRGKKR